MLGEVDGVGLAISLDLDSEHPVKFTEVGDLDVLLEAGLEVLDKAEGAGSDGAVVDMHRDNCELVSGLVLFVKDGLID